MIPDALTGAVAEPAREDSANRVAALFDAHHQRLYRLARRLTASHDDARDVVQDTFVRAARRIASVPAGSSREEAWLVRVLVNICRDRWRQRAARARLDAAALPPQPAVRSGESALIARDAIWSALEQLPAKRRAAIVMYELEGASIARIASTLGMNPITVRWHLSRGRRELAQLIQGNTTHG